MPRGRHLSRRPNKGTFIYPKYLEPIASWPGGRGSVGRDYNLYVTDEWLNRVTVFDRDGNYLRHWDDTGDAAGQLNGPSGIDVDSHGDLFIVDSLNHRVQKFTVGGEYLAGWGGLGDGPSEFNTPWGLTVDDQDQVYVADHKNHRVQKFTASGEYMAEFGSYGSGRGELNRPADVAVDPEGDVYICDWANHRVQVFAADGEFITSFIGNAQELSKWFKVTVDANDDVVKARRRVDTLEPEWLLALPCGVAFDAAKSRLIIADTQRRRVQIYNKVKDYMAPQINL
jgi:DNA-binding beta-propeller fold protein YncE